MSSVHYKVIKRVNRAVIKVLKDKWDHLLPTPSTFEMEMSWWAHHCKHVKEEKFVISLLSLHANTTFFSNIRELSKILAAILALISLCEKRSYIAEKHHVSSKIFLA